MLLRHKNNEVLFRFTLYPSVLTSPLSLCKSLARHWLAHWANERNLASIKLHGAKSDALGVVPFAFVFAHKILLIVILLSADAKAIVVLVAEDHLGLPWV